VLGRRHRTFGGATADLDEEEHLPDPGTAAHGQLGHIGKLGGIRRQDRRIDLDGETGIGERTDGLHGRGEVSRDTAHAHVRGWLSAVEASRYRRMPLAAIFSMAARVSSGVTDGDRQTGRPTPLA
jgi:hypothetical protein